MCATNTTILGWAVTKRSRSCFIHVHPGTLVSVIAIADTFGGLVQGIIPATLLMRTAMVCFLLVYVLLSPTLRQDSRILWLILTSYLFCRVFLDYFVSLNLQVLIMEIGTTFKLLYFPLLYTYLHGQIVKGKMVRRDVRRIISLYGWLILGSLVLGHVTGLGGVIAGRGTDIEGGKGFMIGANEVGLMLLLTAPFVGADIMHRLRSVWLGGLVQLFIYGLAGLHVFTKSSLIAALSSGFSVYQTITKSSRRSKWLVKIIVAALCAYLVILILKNLDLIEAFALNTFFSALLNDGIVSFLFRGRQDYISAIYPQLVEHDLNWLFILFGAGELFMRDLSVGPLMLELGEGTTFEMDLFDLIGSYGVVGMVLFGAVVATMFRKAAPYHIPQDIKIAILAVLVHAFLAGHVLFSPQVTSLFALLILHFRVDKTHQFRFPSNQNNFSS
jgi:hypothetical protein